MVGNFNRQRKKTASTLDETARYLSRIQSGKPVRSSTHKMGGARGAWCDGYYFQSAKELRRYQELKLAREAKTITELTVHPHTDIVIGDVKICRVVCDFSYWDEQTQKMIVEDVKDERRGRDGKIKFTTDTTLSKIKQRLMLAVAGIEITIVK